MSCSHPYITVTRVADYRRRFPDVRIMDERWGGDPIAQQCDTCHAWLSRGPSDEMPVAVEVRAAEIAASGAEPTVSDTASIGDRVGWRLAGIHREGRGLGLTPGPGHLAGYLARIIFDHDREHLEAP